MNTATEIERQSSFDAFAALRIDRQAVEIACRDMAVEETKLVSDAAKALLQTWEIAIAPAEKSNVLELLRVHVVVAVTYRKRGFWLDRERTQWKATRARSKRIQGALRTLAQVWLEDMQAPLPFRFTGILSQHQVQVATLALRKLEETCRYGAAIQQAVMAPKRRQSGAPKHLTWDNLIVELHKVFTDNGGKGHDQRFVRGLVAMNAAFPPEARTVATPQAFSKRVGRLFRAAKRGHNSRKTNPNIR